MKRFLLVLIAVVFAFSLVACEKNENGTDDNETKEEFNLFSKAESIISEHSLTEGTVYRSDAETDEEKLSDDMIHSLYGDIASDPDFSKISDYAVFIGNNSLKPCEFGIFKLNSESYAEEFMLYIQAHIDEKIEHARSYPEIDDEAWTTAKLESKNGYVWYFVIKGENEKLNSEMKEKV